MTDRVYGADLIQLRPCLECGEWPYLHTPECSVTAFRERENAELARRAAASPFPARPIDAAKKEPTEGAS